MIFFFRIKQKPTSPKENKKKTKHIFKCWKNIFYGRKCNQTLQKLEFRWKRPFSMKSSPIKHPRSAKGFIRKQCIDYNEIFLPVVKCTTNILIWTNWCKNYFLAWGLERNYSCELVTRLYRKEKIWLCVIVKKTLIWT